MSTLHQRNWSQLGKTWIFLTCYWQGCGWLTFLGSFSLHMPATSPRMNCSLLGLFHLQWTAQQPHRQPWRATTLSSPWSEGKWIRESQQSLSPHILLLQAPQLLCRSSGSLHCCSLWLKQCSPRYPSLTPSLPLRFLLKTSACQKSLTWSFHLNNMPWYSPSPYPEFNFHHNTLIT